MKVLELGCGNSQLSENLYKDGVTRITCIDLSAVAVESMQKRVQSKGYKGIRAFIFAEIITLRTFHLHSHINRLRLFN